MGDTKSWMWFSNWTATSPIRELRKQVCCLSKVTWAVSSQTETALVPFFLPLHLTPSSTASGGLQRGPPQTFCQRGQSLGLALYPACSFLPTQLRGTYSALVPSQNTPLPWPTSHGYLPPHCLLLFGLLSWTPLLSSFPGRKGRRTWSQIFLPAYSSLQSDLSRPHLWPSNFQFISPAPASPLRSHAWLLSCIFWTVLRYNSHTIPFVHLECTILWISIYPWSRATIII